VIAGHPNLNLYLNPSASPLPRLQPPSVLGIKIKIKITIKIKRAECAVR
jgi:hypothetical protein